MGPNTMESSPKRDKTPIQSPKKIQVPPAPMKPAPKTPDKPVTGPVKRKIEF